METENIKAPKVCINKCKYDEFDLCSGCYRTKKEIVDWIDYTENQKFEVIEKIKIRRLPGKKYTL
jgi:predicted Fe-S protein YdhL (DUF1289 family)